MPTVQAQGKTLICESGANLRQLLLQHEVELHNGAASLINCRGLGTCGTCAVQIVGVVSELCWREQTRLGLPPHRPECDRRLACQVNVLGDLAVTKYDGFWGQGEQLVWTAAQKPTPEHPTPPGAQ